MTPEPQSDLQIKLEALEKLIQSGTEEQRRAFYREIEGLFSDMVGFCIDQLELSYPFDKANPDSDNARKFDTARRMILNKLNQDTYNRLKKLLNQHSTIRIIEPKPVADVHNIQFGNPTLATGKRSKG